MKGYILSILGIVIVGILIDIIIPSGAINKYIKSVYSVFIVAVIVMPIVKFFNKNKDFVIHYQDYEISDKLLNYISNKQVQELESRIEFELDSSGFKEIDIILKFEIKDNQLFYNSCVVNLENLVIESNSQHIISYDYIKEVIIKHTNLTEEVIVINELKHKKNIFEMAYKNKKYQTHWNLHNYYFCGGVAFNLYV